MKQIKNENGIKMFYEINRHDDKVEIYDSNKKYFNDLYYEDWDKDDISAILNMLKQTDLQEMATFFGFNVYDTAEELLYREHINDYDENTIKENDYVNIFKVKDHIYYVCADL